MAVQLLYLRVAWQWKGKYVRGPLRGYISLETVRLGINTPVSLFMNEVFLKRYSGCYASNKVARRASRWAEP